VGCSHQDESILGHFVNDMASTILLSVFDVTFMILNLEDADDMASQEGMFALEFNDGISYVSFLGPEESKMVVDFSRLLLFFSLKE